MATGDGKVLIDFRSSNARWHGGLPAGPGILWSAPVVVVVSPLINRPAWQSWLDEVDRARLNGVRNPEARAEKLAAHALLRLLLGRVDQASPKQHALFREERGRPHPVRLPEWSCSLSHDASGVAVVVGAGGAPADRLGVDICRPLPDRAGLNFVLHHAEKRFLDSDFISPDRTLARFWASKEALVKRWGWGLIPGLDRICTLPGSRYLSDVPLPLGADSPTASTITSRCLDDGPAVAVAHRPDQIPTWWRVSHACLDRAFHQLKTETEAQFSDGLIS